MFIHDFKISFDNNKDTTYARVNTKCIDLLVRKKSITIFEAFSTFINKPFEVLDLDKVSNVP